MVSRQLKIGFVLDTSLDPNDGVQQYVLRLGEWLSANGHEVHYLVGETKERKLPNIHSLSKNLSVKFNGNRTTIPLWASRKKVRKLLARLQLDVLHVQMPHHPLMAQTIILCASADTAIVGTFHILPVTVKETIATKLLGYTLRPSLRRFDEILAVSQPAQTFLERTFGVSSIVLPNVVDLGWYRSSSIADRNSDKVKIVFLGRLVERKGAMQLLQAVAALPASTLAKIQVILGGKGPLLSELQSFIRFAKLDKTIRFEGFIEEAAKPNFLHQADIAVFPSLGGESFGIVLLEAMAAEAGIVLGGNNPGYASVLAPFPETLFNPSDTAEFSDTLRTYIENKAKRQRIYHLQQRHIQTFDVQVVGPKLLGYYENAIAKKQRNKDNKR